MTIALCLHGLFNSERDSSSSGFDGYEHIRKHILSKGDVDVYIHSWQTDMQELICGMYNPKDAVFETQKDFTHILSRPGISELQGCPRPAYAVLSHLYSVTESIKLALDNHKKYDIIVKARFDLGRINRNTSGPGRGNPYPVQCINFNTDVEIDKIYMADWNHFHMGPADMWFYGSEQTMNHFKNLYQTLEEQMYINSDFHQFATKIEGNPGDLTHAVAFYKWWMIQNGLWENRINLETTWE
jgi:hypothetical protein